jgi:hypothetical protein
MQKMECSEHDNNPGNRKKSSVHNLIHVGHIFVLKTETMIEKMLFKRKLNNICDGFTLIGDGMSLVILRYPKIISSLMPPVTDRVDELKSIIDDDALHGANLWTLINLTFLGTRKFLLTLFDNQSATGRSEFVNEK